MNKIILTMLCLFLIGQALYAQKVYDNYITRVIQPVNPGNDKFYTYHRKENGNLVFAVTINEWSRDAFFRFEDYEYIFDYRKDGKWYDLFLLELNTDLELVSLDLVDLDVGHARFELLDDGILYVDGVKFYSSDSDPLLAYYDSTYNLIKSSTVDVNAERYAEPKLHYLFDHKYNSWDWRVGDYPERDKHEFGTTFIGRLDENFEVEWMKNINPYSNSDCEALTVINRDNKLDLIGSTYSDTILIGDSIYHFPYKCEKTVYLIRIDEHGEVEVFDQIYSKEQPIAFSPFRSHDYRHGDGNYLVLRAGDSDIYFNDQLISDSFHNLHVKYDFEKKVEWAYKSGMTVTARYLLQDSTTLLYACCGYGGFYHGDVHIAEPEPQDYRTPFYLIKLDKNGKMTHYRRFYGTIETIDEERSNIFVNTGHGERSVIKLMWRGEQPEYGDYISVFDTNDLSEKHMVKITNTDYHHMFIRNKCPIHLKDNKYLLTMQLNQDSVMIEDSMYLATQYGCTRTTKQIQKSDMIFIEFDLDRNVAIDSGSQTDNSPRPIQVKDILVYPTPSRNQVRIEFPDQCAEISIFHISGQLIEKIDVESGTLHNISSYKAGSYIVSAQSNSGIYMGRFEKIE